jgi:hypothetical protein
MAWLKFYGFIAGAWFTVAWAQIHYLGLFDDIEAKPAGEQSFVFWFSTLPLVFLLPVILLFFWWAAGALVRYARWQLRQPLLWRCFWLGILLFYGYVLLDPLDSIHPQMSRKGLAPMLNFNELVANWGRLAGEHKLWPPPLFQFQWGYFILWFLLWFLLIILHWQYFLDFLREAWFYARRFQRYGVSVLTGFRETARLAGSQPVTRDYPRQRPELPPVFRGAPQLNVSELSPAEAQAIISADSSGAMVLPPQQTNALFVDLGVYDFSPALAELRRADGTPLLRFTGSWPLPETRREALVVALAQPATALGRAAAIAAPEPPQPVDVGPAPAESGEASA